MVKKLKNLTKIIKVLEYLKEFRKFKKKFETHNLNIYKSSNLKFQKYRNLKI